ncbi:MAG: TetR/AcrR family transcriptional regulator [Pseudomonadota bacterium]
MGDMVLDIDGVFVPRQERAKKTYEKILLSAQEILEECGIEALNSNAVVERAGVTAPVFYRYFKNKHVLLAVLGDRLIEAQNDIYLDIANQYNENENSVDNIEVYVLETLKQTYDLHRKFVGAKVLLAALRAIPSLSAMRLKGNREMANVTTEQLMLIRPELSRNEAYERTRVAIEIGYSIVEMLLDDKRLPRMRILEKAAASIVCAYLN